MHRKWSGTEEIKMNGQYDYLRHMTPELTARECGGWLAVAPKDAAIRIGVTGSTEKEARENFALSLDRWIENLQAPV
jgi:hypothetical protein